MSYFVSRVALITGASRGIGAFLAQRLLADGWAVASVSRTCAEVESARELSFPMDVTDVESVRAGIRRIQRHFGGLDAVVNNAGIASMNAAALASTESVTRMFEVNTVGTFTVSREALRALRKSASPRIVNLSSIAVPLHLEGEAAYGASKAAVEHLTRVMAREFAEWGITVNAIGPSAIATDLTSGVPRSALDALQARLSSSEPATMDDVYWTVSFLLDERSQLVTGQVMYLGGP